MTKRLIATGLLAALMVLAIPALSAAAPAPPSPRHPRVVVLLLAPYLRWEDVTSEAMVETQRLAEAGGVANMNVRSLLPDAGEPSADSGALMLSAGAWARYYTGGSAPVASEQPTGGAAFPGLSFQRSSNAREDVDIRFGSLGQAIADAGGWTAAIGNADGRAPSRPAALVAMDAAGAVRHGDVSTRTVTVTGSRDLPLGRVSNAARILAVLGDVLRLPGRGLVVLDPGDLSRAHAELAGRPESEAGIERVSALEAFDTQVGMVSRQLPPDALLVIAGPVAAKAEGEPSGFAPLIVASPGYEGLLTSGSTHKDGLVTNADLTATILAMLDVRRPVQINGNAISATPSADDGVRRIMDLDRTDAFMRAVDGARSDVTGDFIVAIAVVLGISTALVMSRRPPRVSMSVAQIAILALLGVPAATLLMHIVVPEPTTGSTVVALLLSTSVVVMTLSIVTHRHRASSRPVTFVASLVAEVILLDQWLGGRWSLDALFGYSPLVGARYYGIGNEYAALMIGAALTTLALVLDTWPDKPWRGPLLRYGVPLIGFACVVTAAAPWLGANIGVAVWGTVAFALGWWGMLGRKLDWKAVAAVALIAVVLVAALVAVDLGRPPAQRTHFGRSVLGAERGGVTTLATIVARKAAANVRVSFGTDWAWLFLAIAALLVLVRFRPRGVLKEILEKRPSFGAMLTAVLAASVISYLTEDSGIIVPALLLLFPATALIYLVLEQRIEEGSPR